MLTLPDHFDLLLSNIEPEEARARVGRVPALESP